MNKFLHIKCQIIMKSSLFFYKDKSKIKLYFVSKNK